MTNQLSSPVLRILKFACVHHCLYNVFIYTFSNGDLELIFPPFSSNLIALMHTFSSPAYSGSPFYYMPIIQPDLDSNQNAPNTPKFLKVW